MFSSIREWREALREGRRFEYDGVVYSYDESRIDRGQSAYIWTTWEGRTGSIMTDWKFYNQVTEIIELEWMPKAGEVIFIANHECCLGVNARPFVEYLAEAEFPWVVKEDNGLMVYKIAAPLPIQVELNRYLEALEKIAAIDSGWFRKTALEALYSKGEHQ